MGCMTALQKFRRFLTVTVGAIMGISLVRVLTAAFHGGNMVGDMIVLSALFVAVALTAR